MKYKDDLINKNGKFNGALLKKEIWLKYLCITENVSANIERLKTISSITGKETLEYVFKTLEILETEKRNISEHNYHILETVLKWSEVSKGGTKQERELWEKQGLALDIHNLASAEIYKEHSTDSIENTKIIYTLIKTHGIIGQYLRGEVNMDANYPLLELRPFFSESEIEHLLIILNKCIIGAVDLDLWNTLEEKVIEAISNLFNLEFKQLPNRLNILFDKKDGVSNQENDFYEKNIFPYFELWYFTIALSMFSIPESIKIMEKILEYKDLNKVNHLNFRPLAINLYYDYESEKHVNIYKQRVIQKYLEDDSNENVSLSVSIINDTAYIDFNFSPACSKLIDFCMEAEKSNLLTYEKSITAIFDMFGFRKDKFDRLNNESKYLNVMNSSEKSTKNSIINYVTGDTVIDVGSGGGVLLDLLEKTYPDKNIIGTDIACNIITRLDDKKLKENHSWSVIMHNFVHNILNIENKGMSIIFSSILHEIYSYTVTPKGKFNIESVKKALKNAYNSLPVGGRIIIRDGIKTDCSCLVKLHFINDEGMTFFKNFCNDFRGLPELPRYNMIDDENKTVIGNINFIREFLYTYTWGKASYPHEVQEQFGYFTLREYVEFLESLGAEIIKAEEFLEPGYKEHLSPLVELYDTHDNEIDFPDSNCIIVIEKK